MARVAGAAKRGFILEAARAVFEREGLDGASLRAIAAEAGYTPAALYFHFESREAIYAELLHLSLARLGEAVRGAEGFVGVGMAFFGFYAAHPRELDLGFYLFRGGMKPAGLGVARDEALNAALGAALRPIAAAAEGLGADAARAREVVVGVFAHAAGLLLLTHTGRIRMFGDSGAGLMERYLRDQEAGFSAC